MADKACNSPVLLMLKEQAKDPAFPAPSINQAIDIVAAYFGIDQDKGTVFFHWDEGVVWDAQRWV